MTILPLSARETVPYIPRANRDQPDPPTFHLAVPTMLGRAQWRRDVAAAGARYPGDEEMLAALRQAVEIIVDPADRDAALETIALWEATPEAEHSDEQKAALAELEEAAVKLNDPYARLRAERTYWTSVAPLVAFRQFVTGWSGLAVEYSQTPRGVAESAMRRLSEALIGEVGFHAISLMTVTEDQEKN